jgi:hypothetical protein
MRGGKMNRRKYLSGVAGLVAGACASPMVLIPAATAQDTEPKKEPPMIAGPDPDTKTPSFKLPRGAIDTHTHIFGPASKYPFAADRTYSAPEAPLSMFRDVHAKIGCDRAVIVNATIHGTDNRVVTDATAAYPEQYKGLAVVADTISDAELDALNKAGMRGCRFAFLKRLGGVKDMAAFTRLAHRAAEIGWHIDVYLDPGSRCRPITSSTIWERRKPPRVSTIRASRRCSICSGAIRNAGSRLPVSSALPRPESRSMTRFPSPRRSSTTLRIGCCGERTGRTPM